MDTHPSGPTRHGSSEPHSREPHSAGPIAWPAVLGLGALVLLWPLTGLTGVAGAIGTIPRAIGVVAVIGAAWIGVVGFAGLPRPIFTLTLTGMAGGLYITAASLVAGVAAGGGMSALGLPFLLLDMLGGGALWGVLAGLVAAGVQKVKR